MAKNSSHTKGFDMMLITLAAAEEGGSLLLVRRSLWRPRLMILRSLDYPLQPDKADLCATMKSARVRSSARVIVAASHHRVAQCKRRERFDRAARLGADCGTPTRSAARIPPTFLGLSPMSGTMLANSVQRPSTASERSARARVSLTPPVATDPANGPHSSAKVRLLT